MAHKKLVVISHTEHCKSKDGLIFGWGPTVEEINHVSKLFDEVVHVGCFESIEDIPRSYRLYTNTNVSFLPIPMFGGKSVLKKLSILFKMPRILRQIEKALRGASHVQIRVPMGIGVFLIPYFSLRSRKFILWVKYANNWGDSKPRLGFRIQRHMLRQNWANCKVTMNGSWPKQELHCLSFENPCLYKCEIIDLQTVKKIKSYNNPFNLLFVGRIEREKGVGVIIDWLSKINLSEIGVITFVGGGKDLNNFLKLTVDLGLTNRINFTGPKSREELHDLYKSHHFILLPSMASEGFPKVIAEAMAFGCVPVTSEVSSLKEFLNKTNAGISWKEFIEQDLRQIRIPDSLLENGFRLAQKYTFEWYSQRLEKEVFT